MKTYNDDIQRVINSNVELEKMIKGLKGTRQKVEFDTDTLRELLEELLTCRQEIKRLRNK